MKFEKLTLWHDVGFMDGSMTVPKKGSSLPTPSMIIRDGFYPSKTRLWSEVRVVKSFDDIEPMSYMRIDAAYSNGASATIYGWIDDVSMISDTPGHPLTSISWHIDEWRTFIDSCVFGSGTVLRRPASPTARDIPPQPYSHHYITARNPHYTFTDPSASGAKIWWCYLTINWAHDSKVQTVTLAFPFENNSVDESDDNLLFIKPPNSEVAVPAPNRNCVEFGLIDEVLGVDPQNLISGFICPYSPRPYTGKGTSGDPIRFTSWVNDSGNALFHQDGALAGAFNFISGKTIVPVKHIVNTAWSDDYTKYIVTGYQGEIIGDLPHGIYFGVFYLRPIVSASGCYVQLREGVLGDQISSSINGMTYNVPMIAVDISENAKSSYNYSGARQSDIDQIKLDADKSRVIGLLGTADSTISGGMMGMMSGNPLAGVGGAIAGGVSSVAKTEAQYRYDTGEFADRQIAINQYRASHQSNALIMAGAGTDAIYNGQLITISKANVDSYSEKNAKSDIAKWGAHVTEPIDDCSGLIAKGGGLQIANLYVGGSIPVSAKRYIKTKFANGLRMI